MRPATRNLLVAGAALAAAGLAYWLWLAPGDDRDGDRAADENGAHTTGDPDTGDDPGGATRPGFARLPPALAVDDFAKNFEYRANGALVPVTGQVLDADSREPVPKIDVAFTIASALTRGEDTATSGPDGRFTLALAPGRYRVRASGDGAVAKSGLQLVVGDASAGASNAGREINLVVEVSRLATVRGKVVAGGKPVADAQVSFKSGSPLDRQLFRTGALERTTTTDTGGAFSLRVTPGQIVLTARVGESPGRAGMAQLPALASGERRDGVTVELTGGDVSVAGIVYAPGGAPVAGARVQASVRVPDTQILERVQAVTNEQGEFEVAGLIHGRVALVADADGHGASQPEWFDFEGGVQRGWVQLVLSAAHALDGRVVDPDGEPVADAQVRVWRTVGVKLEPALTTTDGDGRFHFEGLGAGEYYASARAQGFSPTRRQGIRVGGDAAAESIEIAMLRPGGIRGFVRDSDGQPLRSFAVRVERWVPAGTTTTARGAWPTARFSSADGRYELAPLPAGSYELAITADGHAEAHVTGVAVPAGGHGDGSTSLTRAP